MFIYQGAHVRSRILAWQNHRLVSDALLSAVECAHHKYNKTLCNNFLINIYIILTQTVYLYSYKMLTWSFNNTCIWLSMYYHKILPTCMCVCFKLDQTICDPVCEKGSYSLFNCMYLTIHNSTCECGITLQFGPFRLLT